MHTLKTTNWSLAWRRSIWTAVWAAMMVLLVVMCIDLAANQPVIFGIVMLAAFVGSIGLAYTRVSWHNGAYATAGGALIVSLLAICTHTLIEASYWSSVIDQINEEVKADRAVNDARAVVAEKRKERYAASSNGRSAAQIEAELKAAETNTLYTRSGACANATAKESREFCQGYFMLRSKLAAAVEADKLEGMVWSAGTTIEGTAKRNLAAIAILASKILGGKPEEFTALIVVCLVAFTQALLAFALPIGWAPERPRIAPGRTGDRPLSLDASKFDPAYSALSVAPRTPMKALERIAGVEAKPNLPEIPESSPEPDATKMVTDPDDGPGTPAPAPEEPKVEEAPSNVVPIKSYSSAEWKIEKPKRKRTHGDAREWAKECLVYDRRDTSSHLTISDLYDSYVAWCDAADLTAAGQKVVSAKVAKYFGLPHSKAKGARVKGGRLFPGIRFKDVVLKRKVA